MLKVDNIIQLWRVVFVYHGIRAMKPFREAQSKAMRAYVQSGQYHTIAESRIRLTWYHSHALN